MSFNNESVEKAVKRYIKTCIIPGLDRAIEIIENEQEFAKIANPQMALGMEQVRKLIEAEKKEAWKHTDNIKIDIIDELLESGEVEEDK